MDSNNIDNTNDDLIIDYLDNRLDQAGVDAIEKRILEDEDFRKEVLEYKYAISAVLLNERNEISQIVNRISDNNSVIKSTNNQKEKIIQLKTENITKMEEKANKGSALRIAASVLFLFAIGAYFYINSNSNPDPSELFAEYYKKDVASIDSDIKAVAEGMLGSRGVEPADTATVVYSGDRITVVEAANREKVRLTNLSEGLNLFKKADWANSIISLNKYLDSYTDMNIEDYNMALFYAAKAKLNAGHHMKAVNDYNKFLNQSGIDKEMKFNAEWDRAIAYLEVDQSKVKGYLDVIAKDGGHKYQDEAKGLSQYLD